MTEHTAQAEFSAHFDAVEREAIRVAESTPEKDRTKAQWAVLGWLVGPPMEGQGDD